MADVIRFFCQEAFSLTLFVETDGHEDLGNDVVAHTIAAERGKQIVLAADVQQVARVHHQPLSLDERIAKKIARHAGAPTHGVDPRMRLLEGA